MKKINVVLSVLVLFTLLISVASVSAAETGKTLKIGVVSPISGSAALAGKYIVNGVKLLENELNAAGGVMNNGVLYTIEFVYEDNEAKARHHNPMSIKS